MNSFLLNEQHIASPDRERITVSMTASNILDEHSLFAEPILRHPRQSHNAAERGAPSTARQCNAMHPDSSTAQVPFGTIQEISHLFHDSPPASISKEQEHQLRLRYQKGEKNLNRHAGAKSFLAYLHSQAISLAKVTTRDLEQWALTPVALGPGMRNLPNLRAFEGAKGLCALAAEFGYIDAQSRKNLAEFKRPQLDMNSLRIVLQNPELTTKEREYQILLNYQSADHAASHQVGASGFLAFLEHKQSSLAQACTSDLEEWTLTAIRSGSRMVRLPSKRAFDGAKALCALAGEIGYLDPQQAKNLSECIRPQFDVNSLRLVLQNPALTPKERDDQIRLNYQSTVHNPNCHGGVNGILAYLENQGKSLAEVTAGALELWALTPFTTRRGTSKVPDAQAFSGAKALCALAGQVGHIDAQRAKDIAACSRPKYYLSSLLTVLQNPALTPKERDDQIRLNYQTTENNSHHQAGASGILAYLESQAKSLAEVTTSDLERWALTPTTAEGGILPSARAFDGAKALCTLAAEVGLLDAQRAKELAGCKRPQLNLDSLRRILQNPALTPKEREYHILLTYQSSERDHTRRSGASGILAYLESQANSLAGVTKRDLENWSLTPITSPKGKVSLPNEQAFSGAKAFCALAAQVGHIDEYRAKDISDCTRLRSDVNALRIVLQNPELTPKERENHIRLNHQSLEKDINRQAGASALLAYLEAQQSSLAELTKDELENWALTPIARGSGSLPSSQAFDGAKALCALAAQVGYIDLQRAKELAQCPRPQFDVESLRLVLQNPELTPKQRDYHIRLNYQSATKNSHRQAGANGILAYLANKGSSLAEVTTSDLELWALTPIAAGKGKGKLPIPLVFEGAKALCILAGEVGHIDPQRAKDLAQCTRPHFDVKTLHNVLQNPALTPQQCDEYIRLTYQSAENNSLRQAGASGLLTYLEKQDTSLAGVTTSDLQKWSITPISTGKGLPSRLAFEGAKALCALAAQVGKLDAQKALELAQCERPNIDVTSLRIFLQNPLLSRKEREYRIRLTYQSAEHDPNRQAGASAILAYLDNHGSSLAKATTSDLEKWAVTPIASGIGKGNLPNMRAFEGAQQLCVLATEVGHIDPQRAQPFAECVRPRLDVNVLRTALQNPALTPPERDYHIRLHYQSAEDNLYFHTGANGILRYLESQAKSLADVTRSDLLEWAQTRIVAGQVQIPSSTTRAFEGAKALCALAAQVGHIDPQRAQDIAECNLPLPGAQAHKRLRSDNQRASPAMTNSITLPQSDDLQRQLVICRPTSSNRSG